MRFHAVANKMRVVLDEMLAALLDVLVGDFSRQFFRQIEELTTPADGTLRSSSYSGAEDEVDNHRKELLGAAALSTLLSVGTEVNSGADLNNNNATIITALRRGGGDSLNQTGQ